MLPACCSAGEELCSAPGSGHESPQLGRREPVVVPGCCWGTRDRLLLQVGNAGHSFPHACSVSANTLTVCFLAWAFFAPLFFFFFLFPEVLRPQHPAILSNNLYNTGKRKVLFPIFPVAESRQWDGRICPAPW